MVLRRAGAPAHQPPLPSPAPPPLAKAWRIKRRDLQAASQRRAAARSQPPTCQPNDSHKAKREGTTALENKNTRRFNGCTAPFQLHFDQNKSVMAPVLASPTKRAYFANTPLVTGALGGFQSARRLINSSSLTSISILLLSASIVIVSPS